MRFTKPLAHPPNVFLVVNYFIAKMSPICDSNATRCALKYKLFYFNRLAFRRLNRLNIMTNRFPARAGITFFRAMRYSQFVLSPYTDRYINSVAELISKNAVQHSVG